MPKSWNNSSGSLGENIIPVDKALCYVPGGTAPLVSTVVMTVVPAKTAGVREVIVTTPAINNVISNEIIVAAKMAGADRIFFLAELIQYLLSHMELKLSPGWILFAAPEINMLLRPKGKSLALLELMVYMDLQKHW